MGTHGKTSGQASFFRNPFRRQRPEPGRALALSPSTTVQGTALTASYSPITARELRSAMGGELQNARGEGGRYSRASVEEALKVAISPDQMVRAAEAYTRRLGFSADPRELEIEARMNVASILSVPSGQLGGRTRRELVASAARGEDTYAYPPLQLGLSPEERRWNIWKQGSRFDASEFDLRTGVVESDNQRRLPAPAPAPNPRVVDSLPPGS